LNTCKQQRTILLAEDDSTVRNFVVKTLEIVGFQVLTTEDGFKALEKAKGSQRQN